MERQCTFATAAFNLRDKIVATRNFHFCDQNRALSDTLNLDQRYHFLLAFASAASSRVANFGMS